MVKDRNDSRSIQLSANQHKSHELRETKRNIYYLKQKNEKPDNEFLPLTILRRDIIEKKKELETEFSFLLRDFKATLKDFNKTQEFGKIEYALNSAIIMKERLLQIKQQIDLLNWILGDV